jgi:LCP family protein required for cell wall assembly
MSILVFGLVGVVLGAGAERLFGRARRGRRRWPLVVAIVLLVLLGPPLVAGAWAWYQFDQIDRVEVDGSLSGGGGAANFLLVGSDARPGVSGNRSDTLIVLRVDGDGSRIMSIPRDLLVDIAGDRGQQRINAAFNEGPGVLIRTVQDNLGIPIHRYGEISFGSFGDVVDALGGVTINFEHPASDPMSGLDVRQTGPVRLDGDQALAYVRSRTFTELVDGEPRVDPTGDLGRVQRQQTFLRAVLSEASATRNPLELADLTGALGEGVRIDDEMNLFDALQFAWWARAFDPESLTLPTEPTTLDSGAQVLLLRQTEAEPVLSQFR